MAPYTYGVATRISLLLAVLCLPASASAQFSSAFVSKEFHAELAKVCDPKSWVAVPPAKAALSSAAQCRDARGLVSRARKLDGELARCVRAAGACDAARRRGLDQATQSLQSDYLVSYQEKYKASLGLSSWAIFDAIDNPYKRARGFSKDYIWKGLDGTELVTGRLGARLDEAERDASKEPSAQSSAELADIDRQGGLALSDFLGVSLLIDDNNLFVQISRDDGDYREALRERTRANRVAEELVAVRDRLIALERRLGLRAEPPFTVEDIFKQTRSEQAMLGQKFKPGQIKNFPLADPFFTPAPAAGVVTAAAAAEGPAGKAGGLAAVPTPKIDSLLDSAPAPPAPAELPKRGAFATAVPGQDLYPKDTALIRGEHRLGVTYTVGDPAGAGRFVHKQQDGDCAIVAQQEVLEMEGRVPAGDPVAEERMLVKEARRQGFIPASGDGVIPSYTGDLLAAEGIPVVKYYYSMGESWSAVNERLGAALKRGRLAIVSVDAGVLWNAPLFLNGGHAVLVTGAEVNRLTGKVVGYYINDSGDDPPMGGRLVSAAQFLKAFDSEVGGNFVEVLK